MIATGWPGARASRVTVIRMKVRTSWRHLPLLLESETMRKLTSKTVPLEGPSRGIWSRS